MAPDRIIFANPVKQVSHIRYAASVGVRVMTFDNENELYKVRQHHPTAKMVLRIRCDAKKVRCPLGMKYGAFPKDAPRLMQLAKKLGKNWLKNWLKSINFYSLMHWLHICTISEAII